MKKYSYILMTFAFIAVVALVTKTYFSGIKKTKEFNKSNLTMNITPDEMKTGSVINLPNPILDGNVSLEKAMTLRRSVRSYKDTPMNISEVSQLLWSAQGITNERGFRTAPSAGATFPLEIYLMVNNVTELKKGIYYYQPAQNSIEMISESDVSVELMKACLSQSMIKDGGVVIIFTAIFERTTARYGERGIR